MSKKKDSLIKVWAVTYDTHMEDVPMIAVADRCVRAWRRQIKAGDRASLVVRVAQEMGTTLVVAEHIINRFATAKRP